MVQSSKCFLSNLTQGQKLVLEQHEDEQMMTEYEFLMKYLFKQMFLLNYAYFMTIFQRQFCSTCAQRERERALRDKTLCHVGKRLFMPKGTSSRPSLDLTDNLITLQTVKKKRKKKGLEPQEMRLR